MIRGRVLMSEENADSHEFHRSCAVWGAGDRGGGRAETDGEVEVEVD